MVYIQSLACPRNIPMNFGAHGGRFHIVNTNATYSLHQRITDFNFNDHAISNTVTQNAVEVIMIPAESVNRMNERRKLWSMQRRQRQATIDLPTALTSPISTSSTSSFSSSSSSSSPSPSSSCTPSPSSPSTKVTALDHDTLMPTVADSQHATSAPSSSSSSSSLTPSSSLSVSFSGGRGRRRSIIVRVFENPSLVDVAAHLSHDDYADPVKPTPSLSTDEKTRYPQQQQPQEEEKEEGCEEKQQQRQHRWHHQILIHVQPYRASSSASTPSTVIATSPRSKHALSSSSSLPSSSASSSSLSSSVSRVPMVWVLQLQSFLLLLLQDVLQLRPRTNDCFSSSDTSEASTSFSTSSSSSSSPIPSASAPPIPTPSPSSRLGRVVVSVSNNGTLTSTDVISNNFSLKDGGGRAVISVLLQCFT